MALELGALGGHGADEAGGGCGRPSAPRFYTLRRTARLRACA